MADYVCTELKTSKNIHGVYDCVTWVETPELTPFLPELTQQEANDLGSSIIFCLMFAWGWKQLQKAF